MRWRGERHFLLSQNIYSVSINCFSFDNKLWTKKKHHWGCGALIWVSNCCVSALTLACIQSYAPLHTLQRTCFESWNAGRGYCNNQNALQQPALTVDFPTEAVICWHLEWVASVSNKKWPDSHPLASSVCVVRYMMRCFFASFKTVCAKSWYRVSGGLVSAVSVTEDEKETQ